MGGILHPPSYPFLSPLFPSRHPLARFLREVGVHIDVVGTLHLPEVTAIAHGHHAVDAEELHLLRQELALLTLSLGCLDCALDQRCPLQIPDLRWEWTLGMAETGET